MTNLLQDPAPYPSPFTSLKTVVTVMTLSDFFSNEGVQTNGRHDNAVDGLSRRPRGGGGSQTLVILLITLNLRRVAPALLNDEPLSV